MEIKVHYQLYDENYPKHFVVLEILSVPPSYQGYSAQAQHYIRIDLIHYGKPRIYQWDGGMFSVYHVDITTKEILK